MTTYVFPGQGAQTLGMGESLFPEFPTLIEKANQILGYSLPELCLKDPRNCLNQTEYTQPALYVVNALAYLKKIAQAPTPNYVAGHSLGEYNALFAAEVFDFETGLKLVQKRGALMSQAKGGGMAAIIGLTIDTIDTILKEQQFNELSIANDNSYSQTIITGSKAQIEKAQEIFEKAGATMYIPLKVSGAFHSPFMLEAKREFDKFLSCFNFNKPKCMVIANITARPYPENEISYYLSQQITSSVLWTKTIEYLRDQGETNIEEIGPGRVLTGLIKKIHQGK